MDTQAFSVIVVPYELGRPRHGVGCGPEHLLARGAASALASNGATIHAHTIVLSDSFNASGSGEADAAFEIMRLVAGAVRRARDAGTFPVVLAGSCFSTVGAVAGLNELAPGVVWFDAHPDFCEPATTVSGYFDSMGLSVLTGSAWQALRATTLEAPPIPESAVVLAGARSFDDPSEVARLEASDICQLTCDDLRTPAKLIDAVGNLSPATTGVHVHIDLDVLDKAVAEVNVFGAPGGLDGDELNGLLAALLENFPVRAVTLSAYDPAYDKGDRVPPIAVRLLRTIAQTR
ncbi:MAG: arginase family protein [Hyphomicrobium sp.]|uniref:arginase family protein n=1 Tax=Hyphomicrobium sp. TaxID=82 RepID=UPI003D10CFE2